MYMFFLSEIKVCILDIMILPLNNSWFDSEIGYSACVISTKSDKTVFRCVLNVMLTSMFR